MTGISLIFPMAGEGARFGYQFKPFLDFEGQTFIEIAFAPFRPWLGQIRKVYFVYLRSQEEAHRVSDRLAQMFPGVDFEAVIFDRPTTGPAETLSRCLTREAVEGPVIVCDCDHQLSVDQLMDMPDARPEVACALPTWDIADEQVTAWSVAGMDEGDRVVSIAEKRMPTRGACFRGVIGCYYFADAARQKDIITSHHHVYLSDVVRHHVEHGASVVSVPITAARFFGDPARLKRALEGAPTGPAPGDRPGPR